MGIALVLLSWGAGFLFGAASGTLVSSVKHAWLKQTPIAVLVGASCIGGIGGLFAAGEPTGLSLVDALLRTGLAALLVAAIGKSRRWVRSVAALLLAFPAVLVATDVIDGTITSRLELAIGVATAAAAVAGYLFPERIAWFGSIIGVGVSFTALRLPTSLPSRSPSVLVAVVTSVICVLAWGTLKKPIRRRFVQAGLSLGVVMFLGTVAGVIAVTNARAFAQRGLDEARSGLNAAASGDIAEAENSFQSASVSLKRANKQLSSPYARVSRIVPVLSQHVAVLKDLTATAATVTETANTAAGQADLQQLRVASGAIDIEKMVALRTELDLTDAAIGDAKDALGGSRSPWLVPQLTERLDSLTSQITKAEQSSTQVREILNVVPSILGEQGERRYLLVLPTPAEARPSGGVMGNWAEIQAVNGRITLTQFGRTGQLYEGTPTEKRSTEAPPDYQAHYGQFSAPFSLSNIGMTPDFPTAAKLYAEQYAFSGRKPVDGVISVDPIALQALLGLLGSVEVEAWPEPITGDNAARVLLHDSYAQIGGDSVEREELLEEVSLGVWSKLTGGESPSPKALIDALAPSVQSRHLQIWMKDAEEQVYLRSIGMTGNVPALTGDSVGVTVINGSISKIDYFLKRSVSVDVVVDPTTKKIQSTVTVALRNEIPVEGEPPYVAGAGAASVPPGTNHMYLSVYSPYPLVTALNNANPAVTFPFAELGRNAYSTWVQVAPGETRTLTFTFAGEYPGNPQEYILDVFTPVLVNRDQLSVKVRTTDGSILAGDSSFKSQSAAQLSASLTPKANERFTATWR
jgi:hypothetical protein